MICDKYRGKNTGPQCVNILNILFFAHLQLIQNLLIDFSISEMYQLVIVFFFFPCSC
jgi:hypothetical protein